MRSFSILSRIEFAATLAYGSEPGQLAQSFSILSRIEFAATDDPVRPAGHSKFVSVSSLGSNSLQPDRSLMCPAMLFQFQYPLSDRIRCNRVPSPRLLPVLPPRFSILSRIEFAATLAGAVDIDAAFDVSVSSLGSNSLQRDFSFPLVH